MLGASLDLAHDFSGPGAKPRRMFLLTLTCLAAMLEPLLTSQRSALLVGIALITLLTAATALRRLLRLKQALERR